MAVGQRLLLVGTWHDGVLDLLRSASIVMPDVTFEMDTALVKTLGADSITGS